MASPLLDQELGQRRTVGEHGVLQVIDVSRVDRRRSPWPAGGHLPATHGPLATEPRELGAGVAMPGGGGPGDAAVVVLIDMPAGCAGLGEVVVPAGGDWLRTREYRRHFCSTAAWWPTTSAVNTSGQRRAASCCSSRCQPSCARQRCLPNSGDTLVQHPAVSAHPYNGWRPAPAHAPSRERPPVTRT